MSKTVKSKRRANLSKLCNIMNKMTFDAVDKEIIRRFKIIIDTCDEDITKVKLNTILNDNDNVDLSEFHESFQPYIKHYLFMLKRELIKQKKEAKLSAEKKPVSKAKTRVKAKIKAKAKIKTKKSVKKTTAKKKTAKKTSKK